MSIGIAQSTEALGDIGDAGAGPIGSVTVSRLCFRSIQSARRPV